MLRHPALPSSLPKENGTLENHGVEPDYAVDQDPEGCERRT